MRVCSYYGTLLGVMVLVGSAWGDLIANGNFESGGGGFSTDYFYTTDLTASGTVVVGYDPCDHHPLAASYGDHTSGRGRMLIANGSVDGGAAVWAQTVSVAPNTEYAFYYWLSAWTPATPMPVQIRCLVNEVRAGPAGFTSSAVGEWGLTLIRWNSGANSQASIRLVDRTGTIENNDFALDDIGMIETGGNYVLMTSSTLGGSVESPGEGAFLYPPGESVILEAKCDPGYEFAGWAGQFSDPNPRLWVDMNGDCVATAAFRKLDYQVTIGASGLAADEFSLCGDSTDRLGILCAALESDEPNGLLLGDRRGLCEAIYVFPIFKPPAGIEGLAKIIVSVYGRTFSSGSTVWIGDVGPHRPIAGDVYTTFGPSRIGDILEDSQELVYRLPVRINAAMGNWDVAGVYVSYECPGIPPTLLRRFHDYFSVYQALDRYAHSQSIRDLYALRGDDEPVWEAVLQTTALAEDLAGDRSVLRNAVNAGIGELRDSLNWWQSLVGPVDLSVLAGNIDAILTRFDLAASSGRSCVLSYAQAIGDGSVSQEEARDINQRLADWKAELTILKVSLDDAFAEFTELHRKAVASQDEPLRIAAETMIRAMAPWHAATLDDSGNWTPSNPTYLERVIETLGEVEPE